MASRSLLRTASLALALAVPLQTFAVSPETTDPREIMEAVEDREEGDKMKARLTILITDKAGRERTRVVQTRAMQFDEGRKQLMLFESPADVQNAGLLSVDYDAGGKSDDQWLYLPSLARTTRISGADKSGSFMGTDLTYADMTGKDIADYDYKMLEAGADVDGEAAWRIEAVPRTDKEKTETGYVKSEVWISKDKLVPLQTKAWVREGKRLKYTQFKDIRDVDGHWIAHDILVRTVRNGELESMSRLTFTDLKLNQDDVTEADFTEQRLEQGI